jgi:CDP-diacylglycerol--glycerol-3-phosphate 3-phosphatidyltransferase
MQLNQDADFNFIKHELQAIAGFGAGVLLIVFGLLGYTRDWLAAGQWLLQTALLWGYVCLFIWRRLALNRANPESPLYPSLGWGNRLTILRGGLIAMTGGFLFMDHEAVLMPALLYTLAAMLDRLDGFVARRSQQISLLGNELDINFDALGLVVAPLLAVGLGKLHGSYLLLSAAYYVYQWGLQCRNKRDLPIQPLPPNPLRRTMAGFQMGFVSVALWPLLDSALTTVAGVAFMLPVLFGFAMDWWVVCGRIQRLAYSRLAEWSERFFQPGLRILPALLLFPAMLDAMDSLLVFGLLFSANLMLFGFAGRLGALILIVLLGWHTPGEAGHITSYPLIVAASWILLLGTGRYSLWQWGDEWLKRYDGA